jgi:hypothetical protein
MSAIEQPRFISEVQRRWRDRGLPRTPLDALPVLFAVPMKRARVFMKRSPHEFW